MRVKKEGYIETWYKDVKCPECEALLEIEWKDIFIRRKKVNTFWTFKYVLKYYVKCLRCGSEIEIPEKDIPTIIRREIIYNMDPVEKLLTFYF